MTLTARVPLVTVDRTVLSAYPVGAPRDQLQKMADRTAGKLPKDVADAVLALHHNVTKLGGDFRVTDGYRSVTEQIAARKKYETWLVAGKPKKGTSAYNPSTMKSDYVAQPGMSFHNAGRAIDISTSDLKFPVRADLQLDKLWEAAMPIGWRPIIKAPTEGVSESWHFDFMGEWEPLYDRTHDYAMVAICAALDIGVAIYGRDEARMLQAQLQRAGYDCGRVDGYIGSKTEAALKAARFAPGERDYTKLFALPSSEVLKWKA